MRSHDLTAAPAKRVCRAMSLIVVGVLPLSLLMTLASFEVAAIPGTYAVGADEVYNEPPAPVRIGGRLEWPWSMAFLPDKRILITEMTGRLRIIENGQLLTESITGLPSAHSLLDIALDPEFEVNHIMYLSYVHGTPEAATLRIFRGRLEGTAVVDGHDVLETRPAAPGLRQLGGRLTFSADGLLYLTVGDREQAARAQDMLDHAGSILRIHPDGRIPVDNPFVQRPDALPEIYTYGHRNPQGLVTDAAGNAVWSHEHGPQGGDEINILRAGNNYGWPVTTHGLGYDGLPIGVGPVAAGITPPLYTWTPSIAPSGMTFYDSERIPGWRGSFLVGALRGETVLRIEIRNDRVIRVERLLAHGIGRIRDVRLGPDGFVYLLTDGPDAFLYRLEPLMHVDDAMWSRG
jgi:aldose sugar dehydrogenase